MSLSARTLVRLAAPAALIAAIALLAGVGSAAGTRASYGHGAGLASDSSSGSSSVAEVGDTPEQTISGFGASGDWWTTDLGYFPGSVQKEVASLLFSDEGIALSHYRYNLGGGGVGVDVPTPSQFGAYDESELGFQTRGPESLYVAPGIYDWSHNAGGTTFLRYAAQYHVPTIEANANSAPWEFTTSGQSCGGQLSPSQIDAYVDYIVGVVQHAHDVWHATIKTVSPLNEPDYTRSDCTQEGMQVPPSLRAELVQKLATALAQDAPYAHVVADESSDVGSQFNAEASQWLSAPTANDLAALATHTYDFPSDSTLEQAAAIAKEYGKPLWMTEICCVVGAENNPTYGAGYDPTMTGALPTAYLIWQDLTYGDMSTWDWWVAVSAALGCDPATTQTCATETNTTGYNDGLLYYDPTFASDHDYKVYETKRFWMLGNFSRFVRPGSVRYDVTGAPANVYLLAFKTASGWAVVAINENLSASTPLDLSLPGGAGVQADGAYQTSADDNLSRVAGATMQSDGTFTTSLPAQSVTTLLFRR